MSDETAIRTFLSEFKNQTTDRLSMLEWLTDCIQNPKAMGTENKAEADAVHIMTLHAAKGLEFDVVVVPFIDAQFNVGATDPMILSRQAGMGLSIPGYSKENVIRKAIFSHEKERSILEEIRLFYVTLTRAKAHILLTGKRLKRKNTSRLSLLLPYLEDSGGESQFNFDYAKSSPGETVSLQEVTPKNSHSTMVTYSPPPINQPSTWSVSNILDAYVCPKQMMLKKMRAIEIIESEAQKEGLKMHDQLAQALVQKRQQPLPADPNWMATIMASDWYQRITSSGRLSVEAPFEFHYQDHVVRGRFDAVWYSDSSETFQIFEFKRSIGREHDRYQRQVHFYANVIEASTPGVMFDRLGSAIVNIQTGEMVAIDAIEGHIHDGLFMLKDHTFSTNESACENCPFHSHISDCSHTPLMTAVSK